MVRFVTQKTVVEEIEKKNMPIIDPISGQLAATHRSMNGRLTTHKCCIISITKGPQPSECSREQRINGSKLVLKLVKMNLVNAICYFLT